jgi:hypothetical protein
MNTEGNYDLTIVDVIGPVEDIDTMESLGTYIPVTDFEVDSQVISIPGFLLGNISEDVNVDSVIDGELFFNIGPITEDLPVDSFRPFRGSVFIVDGRFHEDQLPPVDINMIEVLSVDTTLYDTDIDLVEDVQDITNVQPICCSYTIQISDYMEVDQVTWEMTMDQEPVVTVEPVVIEDAVVKELNDVVIAPLVSVSMYPNPVLDHATFVISGLEKFEGVLTVYTTDGKLVQQVQVSGTQFSFERDGLASGTYFYKVSNGGGKIAAGKMILQ